MPNLIHLTGSYYVCLLPEDIEDWYGCEIRGSYNHVTPPLLSFYGQAKAIELPPCDWTLLGNGDEVSEEVCKKIVLDYVMPALGGCFVTYCNYKDVYQIGHPSYRNLDTAKESFTTLLASLNLNPSQVVVLEKMG